MHVLCSVPISSLVPPPIPPPPHAHTHTDTHTCIFLPPNRSPLLSSSLCRPSALLSLLLLPQRPRSQPELQPNHRAGLLSAFLCTAERTSGRKGERKTRGGGTERLDKVTKPMSRVRQEGCSSGGGGGNKKALLSGDNSKAGVKAVCGCLQAHYWVRVKQQTFFKKNYSLGTEKCLMTLRLNHAKDMTIGEKHFVKSQEIYLNNTKREKQR